MIQPRNKTEYLLLPFSKNCKTLIKQTHKKAKRKHWILNRPNKKKHFISHHLYRLKDLER